MITTADFPQLTEEIQEIFDEAARNKVDQMVSKEIFDIGDDNTLNYEHVVLHGLGRPQAVAEGADIPVENHDEGDTITYQQKYYANAFAVTKKMRKFDQYGKIRGMAKSMADGAFDAVDQSLADMLTNGWSTSYTNIYNESVSAVGPDGLAMFSTAHTNGVATSSDTYRNQIKNSAATENPALSRDAIVTARADAMVHRDPKGLARGIMLDTLVVAPENEDLAERIILSSQIQGSQNNDINPLKGKVKRILPWSRTSTNGQGTDTSAYYFMFDSNLVEETLKAKFAERPSLDAPDEVYINKNWVYTLDFFYWSGIGYQAYIWGSQGTG